MPASQVFSGSGDPNGGVRGNPGDLYQDQTGKLWENTAAPSTWTQLGGVVVQDEGTPIGTFNTLNFIGEGSIEAVDAGGGVAQVIVPAMACAVVDGAGSHARADAPRRRDVRLDRATAAPRRPTIDRNHRQDVARRVRGCGCTPTRSSSHRSGSTSIQRHASRKTALPRRARSSTRSRPMTTCTSDGWRRVTSARSTSPIAKTPRLTNRPERSS